MIDILDEFLTANHNLLSMAAIDGIGLIGKSSPFPLQETSDDGSLSKKAVVDSLFEIFTSPKANQKVKINLDKFIEVFKQ